MVRDRGCLLCCVCSSLVLVGSVIVCLFLCVLCVVSESVVLLVCFFVVVVVCRWLNVMLLLVIVLGLFSVSVSVLFGSGWKCSLCEVVLVGRLCVLMCYIGVVFIC